MKPAGKDDGSFSQPQRSHLAYVKEGAGRRATVRAGLAAEPRPAARTGAWGGGPSELYPPSGWLMLVQPAIASQRNHQYNTVTTTNSIPSSLLLFAASCGQLALQHCVAACYDALEAWCCPVRWNLYGITQYRHLKGAAQAARSTGQCYSQPKPLAAWNAIAAATAWLPPQVPT